MWGPESSCCYSVATSVQLFETTWTATRHAPLSFTISQSLLRFMSLPSVMLSSHLILCHPLLLLPSIFLSISVFSNEVVLHIRWPKYLHQVAKVLEVTLPIKIGVTKAQVSGPSSIPSPAHHHFISLTTM